jgi:hypothetical protein
MMGRVAFCGVEDDVDDELPLEAPEEPPPPLQAAANRAAMLKDKKRVLLGYMTKLSSLSS